MSISEKENPLTLFSDWMELAARDEFLEPDAVSLATVSADGKPSLRMVLLKDWSDDGFVFYTNLDSRKARELSRNPNAALCFYWKSIRRQVRIEGAVALVSDETADKYFASRDRGSQIGAWASHQSSPMDNAFSLEKEVVKYTAKFGVAKIPRPANWSGFRLAPTLIEFWKYGKFRLHDRLLYCRDGKGWRTERLFP